MTVSQLTSMVFAMHVKLSAAASDMKDTLAQADVLEDTISRLWWRLQGHLHSPPAFASLRGHTYSLLLHMTAPGVRSVALCYAESPWQRCHG